MSARVMKLAQARRTTFATVESCTAGSLAHLISQAEGASDRLHGGFIVYTKENKTAAVGVPMRDGKLTVYSRRDNDWTDSFASIARAGEILPVRHCVLDGEAIVQDQRGIADHHALRRELARKRTGNLTYYLFDLLYLDGEDLRQRPLSERKEKLKALVAKVPRGFLYADHLEAEAEEVYA
jgi:predicted nucleic acid-binding Zn ribbon protein